ncbi:Rha family transcriptional regulator [Arsenophonus nasoniae]|uniref:Rha family transcriptional regulator n=1 Tax=Arsenophonus nasoniae TaxID=638 RepID=A0AA95GPM1_9GAMM|nr:Rha family transcriptional regulator [Arsenophonus nasoniae]WGM00374.1 Rha family transcriptional regulator [Arsenophonus nasoniae]
MKAVTTKNDNFLATELPMMTSLEMVDYINADRKSKAEAEGLTFPCKKYRKLQHNDFLKKVPKVLGETSGKFFSDDIFTAGNGAKATRRIYRFPKREACLMAMSYSYELQAKVYDYMTDLEENKGLAFTIEQLQNIVATARKASDEDSSDAGRRLRKRKDDLPILKKAEKTVMELSQIPLDLIGGSMRLER